MIWKYLYKKVKVNKVARSLHNFSGILKAVMFSPSDIEVLTHSPATRRRYLDLILFQTHPEYRKALLEYGQAIRQRNKVLEKIRDKGQGMDELGFWNTKIVQNGVLIQEHRDILVNFLSKALMPYGVELDTDQTKLVGPHRDDFEMTLNDMEVIEFCSRGQQRTAVLAMKFAEVDFIKEKTGKKPILLLDDVFSELDQLHEKALMELTKSHQTVISTTDPDKVEGVNTLLIKLN